MRSLPIRVEKPTIKMRWLDRVNGISKNEFLLYECNTMSGLKQLINESVYLYNNIRPHLSVNIKTSAGVHGCYLCPAECKKAR